MRGRGTNNAVIRWLDFGPEDRLEGPEIAALEDRRNRGIGPAASWHVYGPEGHLAAADPYASLLPVLAVLLGAEHFAHAVELGGGDYSTPVLCAGGRAVRTVETDARWARRCGPLTPDHMVGIVDIDTLRTDPDAVLRAENICLDAEDSLLVIDNGPTEADRIPALLCDAAREARAIVLHDAQDSAFSGIIWRRWRFAVMVRNHWVWTAVLSDHADPWALLRRLPGAERVAG